MSEGRINKPDPNHEMSYDNFTTSDLPANTILRYDPKIETMAEAIERHERDVAPHSHRLIGGSLGSPVPSVTKDTNPKDAVGIKKVPMSTVSAPVLMEVGLGMMEGARKYGRHNYRSVGVRASVYYDATLRHLFDWWEGEDIDPASQLSHVTKAITSLVVLRDSMIRGNWDDDRPPRVEAGWMEEYNKKAAQIIDNYPVSVPAHTEKK